jgi:hypothetical protein
MKSIAGRLIKIVLMVIIIMALGAGCSPGKRSALPAPDRTPESRESGYADLGGPTMYDEIQGTGMPLVLSRRPGVGRH